MGAQLKCTKPGESISIPAKGVTATSIVIGRIRCAIVRHSLA
jgi:hypothetical protein